MKLKLLKNHFSRLHPCHFWQLFIDANRNSVGPLGFDQKEPGYLKSLQFAFDFALNHADQPLTADFLVRLHDESLKYAHYTLVVNEEGDRIAHYKQNFDMGVRNHVTDFGIIATGDGQNVTKEGLKSILQRIANGDPFKIEFRFQFKSGVSVNKQFLQPLTDEKVNYLYSLFSDPQLDEVVLDNLNKDPVLIKMNMRNIINRFYDGTAGDVTDHQMILAIATLIHDLEIEHAFTDGNCRTFVLEELPIILMQNGFPPCIVTNPNRFDLFSVGELATEINDGFTRFKSLEQTPPTPTPGHENDILLYLNDATAMMIALYATRTIAHWNEITTGEQDNAINIIKQALLQSDKKELTFDEVNRTILAIQQHVSTKIYQKAGYQAGFFRESSNYGIHFESYLNQLLHYNTLTSERLTIDINRSVSPPAAAAIQAPNP